MWPLGGTEGLIKKATQFRVVVGSPRLDADEGDKPPTDRQGQEMP